MFWLATDDNNRVIGSIGYNSIKDTDEVWLYRLFVIYNLKSQGGRECIVRCSRAISSQTGKENRESSS